MKKHTHTPPICVFFLLILLTGYQTVLFAQKQLSPQVLKKMSIEELTNLEVTSVSKSPEKLTEVASAIQVITHEDIRRSSATRLPEALRLAPNLQAGQTNSHDWAVTARGFNGAPLRSNTLANKLLVMIDGRSIYTPLFGGVFWDAQNVFLEDLDRVEVVSGPGGSLWGANAVNGVINIISKNTRATQGWVASVAAGSFLQDYAGLRYGGRVDSFLHFRVYGQRFDQRNTTSVVDGSDARDDWGLTQGGFRIDYARTDKNAFTLQGDLYAGRADTGNTVINGQNVLGRWSHSFSETSDLSLQMYFDRTWRDLPDAFFRDVLTTYDIDFQHGFAIGVNNAILWGAGYRVMEDAVRNSPTLVFNPATRILHLFSSFVQDRIMLVDEELFLTVGTKFLHNDYTGFEVQPSARLTCTPNEKHTIWTAVSRAVRMPTRFETDESTPFITTRDGVFKSEKVVAYEAGYRIHPVERASFSLAVFYNRYDDLRSINDNDMPPPPLLFANDQRAVTWGVEWSGNFLVTAWWRLRGGYTFLNKRISAKSPSVRSTSVLFEGIDPDNQAFLQSILDIGKNLQFDFTGRYVDALPELGVSTPAIPAYATFDARLAWIFSKFELSIVGQNLTKGKHSEFGTREIPRSIYVKGTLRF